MADLRLFLNGVELKDSDSTPSHQCAIDCLHLDEYKRKNITHTQSSNLSKGKYILTKDDILAVKLSSDLFWGMLNNTGDRDIIKVREAFGLTKDEIKNKKEGDSVFIPLTSAFSRITISFGDNAADVVPDEAKKRLRALYLYANFLGSNITNIYITSTYRSAERQVEIMMRDYLPYSDQKLYTGHSKTLYDNAMNDTNLTMEQRKKRAYDDLVMNIKRQIKDNKGKSTSKGFPHCDPDICVVDTHPFEENVKKSIIRLREKGIYLTPNSLYKGQNSEKANHLIFKGLRPTITT